MMRLYIDDIRPAPEGWMQARTVTDAIKTIAQFGEEITEISLDHDISIPVSANGEYRPFPSPETFQAVAYFLAHTTDRWECNGKDLPKITIHTANPVGGKELQAILEGFPVTVVPATRVNRLESEV